MVRRLSKIAGNLALPDLTVSGVLTNQGTFAVATANVSTFANSGGITSVEPGGTLNLSSLTNSGTINVESGGTLNITNGITSLGPGLTYFSSFYIYGTVNSGGATAGNSTLSGLTTIDGALYLENGETTNITPNGGTLAVAGMLYVEGGGTVANVAGTLGALSPFAVVEVDSGATLNLTSSITDLSGSVKIVGTLNSGALAGLTNTTGSLELDSGQFHIAPGGGTWTNSGYVIDAGAQVTVAGNLTNFNLFNANGLTVNGTLTNQSGGGLSVQGAATTNALTNGGYVGVASGIAFEVGSGKLPAGTTGYYQFANATLAELIFGAASGSGDTCEAFRGTCGGIGVNGAAYLSGILDPQLQNGFDPYNGENFVFMTFADGWTGPGFTLEDEYFNNNTQYWALTYGSNFVELTAESTTPAPEPGTLFGSLVVLAALGLITRRHTSACL